MRDIYLGDSVYAHDDGYYIILTLDERFQDGKPQKRVYLEPEVLTALDKFVRSRSTGEAGTPTSSEVSP